MATASRDARIGTTLKGRWRIDSRLGRGGVATVYAATHRNGNRVAIKMLNGEFSRHQDVRARFLREGYAANAVNHPGVVRVLDDDIAEDGSAFLVMDLLEGEMLDERRVRLGGRLQFQEVLGIASQLLDVLAAAHDKSIIHRDIKPENIFIERDGAVKVLDFGIARMRVAAQENTATGMLLGTPEFMSPEQANGNQGQVDAKTDIWATGATMFTLLSGEPVHDCDTTAAQILATISRPARSLSAVAKDVPRPLVAVVDRALAFDKGKRWPDAMAMKAGVEAAARAIGVPVPGLGSKAAPPPAQPQPRPAKLTGDEPTIVTDELTFDEDPVMSSEPITNKRPRPASSHAPNTSLTDIDPAASTEPTPVAISASFLIPDEESAKTRVVVPRASSPDGGFIFVEAPTVRHHSPQDHSPYAQRSSPTHVKAPSSTRAIGIIVTIVALLFWAILTLAIRSMLRNDDPEPVPTVPVPASTETP